MNTSARCANIRAMVADDDELRKIASEMVDRMELLSNEDARGSHLARILDPNAPAPNFMARSKARVHSIPAHHYKLLCDYIDSGRSVSTVPVEATFFDEISLQGICYSTHTSTAYRNSAIIFHERETAQAQTSYGCQTKAGIIESIFQYSHDHAAIVTGQRVKEIYLVVEELAPVDISDDFLDPYRRFGFAGGYLCRSDGRVLRVIHISQVLSHFALTKMRGEGFESLIQVLPVDKVRMPILQINMLFLKSDTAHVFIPGYL